MKPKVLAMMHFGLSQHIKMTAQCKVASLIAHIPLKDPLNGNHKQLRDEKENAALQEPIETTNIQSRQEIARL